MILLGLLMLLLLASGLLKLAAPAWQDSLLADLIGHQALWQRLLGGIEILIAGLLFWRRARFWLLRGLVFFLMLALPLHFTELSRVYPRPCGCWGEIKVKIFENSVATEQLGTRLSFGALIAITLITLLLCLMSKINKKEKTS